jgi:hypothetical protein
MAWLQKTHKADQRAVTAGEDVISQSQRDVAAQKGMKQVLGGVSQHLISNLPMSQKLSALKAAYGAAGEAAAGIRSKLTGQEVAAKQARKSETMGLGERNKDRRRQNVQATVKTLQEGPGKSAADAPYEEIIKTV